MLSHKFISPIRVSLITNTIRRDSFSYISLSLYLSLYSRPPEESHGQVAATAFESSLPDDFKNNRWKDTRQPAMSSAVLETLKVLEVTEVLEFLEMFRRLLRQTSTSSRTRYVSTKFSSKVYIHRIAR